MQPIQSADSVTKNLEQKEGEFSREDSVTSRIQKSDIVSELSNINQELIFSQRKLENEVNIYSIYLL